MEQPTGDQILERDCATSLAGVQALAAIHDVMDDRTPDDTAEVIEPEPRDDLRAAVMTFLQHVSREHEPDLTDTALDLEAVREARDLLAKFAERDLENRLGSLMKGKRTTVPGMGTLERHQRKSMTQWDKEALLSAVLDSRIVNEDTGEVVEETPLEKVLDCWNLPAPRTTALRKRKIQPDEFCQVEEQDGYSIRVHAS